MDGHYNPVVFGVGCVTTDAPRAELPYEDIYELIDTALHSYHKQRALQAAVKVVQWTDEVGARIRRAEWSDIESPPPWTAEELEEKISGR